MLVLAIDTALAACSVAVLDAANGAILGRESLPMVRGQAEILIPMVGRVMQQAGIKFDALGRVAVTVGPGSFTGLRVGIAAARGIALAAAKPAIGLSTLAAFAAPHIAADDTQSVVTVVDARHEHVYLQVFGPAGRTVVSPRIASLREAVSIAASGAARLTGNAADMIAHAWPPGRPAPAVVDARAAPDIDWVARLGAAASDSQDPPKPLYLRAPDAQPQDAARLPRR
jgi:tRNA threonylcarbamoyl adenosine modification protein YeaZ